MNHRTYRSPSKRNPGQHLTIRFFLLLFHFISCAIPGAMAQTDTSRGWKEFLETHTIYPHDEYLGCRCKDPITGVEACPRQSINGAQGGSGNTCAAFIDDRGEARCACFKCNDAPPGAFCEGLPTLSGTGTCRRDPRTGGCTEINYVPGCRYDRSTRSCVGGDQCRGFSRCTKHEVIEPDGTDKSYCSCDCGASGLICSGNQQTCGYSRKEGYFCRKTGCTDHSECTGPERICSTYTGTCYCASSGDCVAGYHCNTDLLTCEPNPDGATCETVGCPRYMQCDLNYNPPRCMPDNSFNPNSDECRKDDGQGGPSPSPCPEGKICVYSFDLATGLLRSTCAAPCGGSPEVSGNAPVCGGACARESEQCRPSTGSDGSPICRCVPDCEAQNVPKCTDGWCGTGRVCTTAPSRDGLMCGCTPINGSTTGGAAHRPDR